MGNPSSDSTPNQTTKNCEGDSCKIEEAPKPKLKPCCACPETKKVRDECIVEKGEVNCQDLIEAHKKCMRDMGFNI